MTRSLIIQLIMLDCRNCGMTLIQHSILRIRTLIVPYIRTFARSGTGNLISASFFSQALGLITSLIIVRFLKPAELGEIRVIATYIGYVQLLGSLGLTASMLAYIPRSNDLGERRWWLTKTLQITGISTLFVSIIAVWLSSQGLLMHDPCTAYWYQWSLLGCLASTLGSVLIAFYQAERAVRQLASLQSKIRIIIFILVIGGGWVAGFIGYVVAGIISSFLMLGGLLGVLRKRPSSLIRVQFPVGFLQTAGFAFVANICWSAGRTADVVVLDRYLVDRAQFGCYALAITIVSILSVVSSSIQVVTVPFFAAHSQDGEWVLLNARKWQFAGLIVALFSAVAVICFATVLVRFVYGEIYLPTILFLIPLLIAQCLLSTFHIQAAALMGTNLVRVNTIVAAIVVPLSVITAIFMIRKYGVWGAAWAQVISAFVYAGFQSSWGWVALSRKARICRRTLCHTL
jgi:O-antigen/teichoic acid export membrane protein